MIGIIISILYIGCISLVGNRAIKLGRSLFFWVFLSFLISPLISWIILEMMGEDKENLTQKKESNVQADKPGVEWQNNTYRQGIIIVFCVLLFLFVIGLLCIPFLTIKSK